MQYTLKQTHKIIMRLRPEVSNRVTIATKKTRPVFVPRENPDTPPAITESTRELARLMRTTTPITAHSTTISAFMNHIPVFMPEKPRPLWVCASAPVKGKESGKIYTAYENIRPEDKPAFRHDSLFLFDSLSEDY